MILIKCLIFSTQLGDKGLNRAVLTPLGKVRILKTVSKQDTQKMYWCKCTTGYNGLVRGGTGFRAEISYLDKVGKTGG